jgi:multimeric flavodoxin WrbA
MSSETREFVIINGSPKITERSVSGTLALKAQARFQTAGQQTSVIHVGRSLKETACENDYHEMRAADGLLLIFPLYYFCVPGVLMRFMEDYAAYIARSGGLSRPQNIYAIVNCGFPEPDINGEAIRVIQSFARHIGASFRFGVGLGCGGMLVGAKDAPFMKKAIAAMDGALDLMARQTTGGSAESTENVNIAVHLPRRLYYFMGNRGWFGMARKNGLKKKDLYARPYQAMSINSGRRRS